MNDNKIIQIEIQVNSQQKELTQDQLQTVRRVISVLKSRNMNVSLVFENNKVFNADLFV
jgi:hypothetical protein